MRWVPKTKALQSRNANLSLTRESMDGQMDFVCLLDAVFNTDNEISLRSVDQLIFFPES